MSARNTSSPRLLDESIAFRLYADYTSGMTIRDLARLCSRSEGWVEERIEAARLCFEKQVRIAVRQEAAVCAETVWAAQIWD